MEIIDKIIDFLGKIILFFVLLWIIINKIFNFIFEKLTSYGWGK
ncbi:MAG: hypothetical protein KatS3mg095_0153 [Candidatus Parcubacteria bacterium]|nr:MAG: hypothetical protein KatS3mg095_0153 [Candidatus Parcubacteria bacterium]